MVIFLKCASETEEDQHCRVTTPLIHHPLRLGSRTILEFKPTWFPMETFAVQSFWTLVNLRQTTLLWDCAAAYSRENSGCNVRIMWFARGLAVMADFGQTDFGQFSCFLLLTDFGQTDFSVLAKISEPKKPKPQRPKP